MANTSDINGQITWVYAEDLEEACRFYGTILGLKVERDAGAAVIYRCTGQSFVGVCQAFEDRVVEPKGSMITFLTGDVDGWHARLQAAGAQVDGPPHILEQFGIYTFFARDPNGYRIEFQKFMEE